MSPQSFLGKLLVLSPLTVALTALWLEHSEFQVFPSRLAGTLLASPTFELIDSSLNDPYAPTPGLHDLMIFAFYRASYVQAYPFSLRLTQARRALQHHPRPSQFNPLVPPRSGSRWRSHTGHLTSDPHLITRIRCGSDYLFRCRLRHDQRGISGDPH